MSQNSRDVEKKNDYCNTDNRIVSQNKMIYTTGVKHQGCENCRMTHQSAPVRSFRSALLENPSNWYCSRCVYHVANSSYFFAAELWLFMCASKQLDGRNSDDVAIFTSGVVFVFIICYHVEFGAINFLCVSLRCMCLFVLSSFIFCFFIYFSMFFEAGLYLVPGEVCIDSILR